MIDIDHQDGDITITFPKVRAGQTMISAIAIATLSADAKPMSGISLSKTSSLLPTTSMMWAEP